MEKVFIPLRPGLLKFSIVVFWHGVCLFSKLALHDYCKCSTNLNSKKENTKHFMLEITNFAKEGALCKNFLSFGKREGREVEFSLFFLFNVQIIRRNDCIALI